MRSSAAWSPGATRTASPSSPIGRSVANGLGATFGWVMLGPAPHDVTEIASRHDVPVVDHLEEPNLQSFGGDVAVAALAAYANEHDFRV